MKAKMNPAGIAALAKGDDVKAKLKTVAKSVARDTERNARITRYKPRCKITDTDDGVRVSRVEPFAAIDEFGTVNNPPSAALRRAAQGQGLKVNES